MHAGIHVSEFRCSESSIINRQVELALILPPLTDQTRRLAVVMPSWIGDTVMATPVLRALRSSLPNARIIGIMRRGLDDILRGTPWLDEMVVCDMKGLGGVGRLAQCMRRTGADSVLLLPNSFRVALGARLAGVKRRIGYVRDGRGWLLTDGKIVTVPLTAPVSAVEYYEQLAEWALGIDPIDRRVELRVTDEERHAAARLLHDVTGRFVLLNPGANRADKRWPAERFAAVGDALASAHGVAILVSGSPSERDVVSSVVAAAKLPIINLLERGVTLASLKAVILRASAVITNDTGPRHIAAALGTPVVTLFGPTDHRWTTLHGVRERILLAEPFLPEELVADQHARACAIEKIAVSDVVAAATSMLSQTTASEAASG